MHEAQYRLFVVSFCLGIRGDVNLDHTQDKIRHAYDIVLAGGSEMPPLPGIPTPLEQKAGLLSLVIVLQHTSREMGLHIWHKALTEA